MPYLTVKRSGKLVNISKDTGKVHGSFPDTQAGHARAAGQIAIMGRAAAAKGEPWTKTTHRAQGGSLRTSRTIGGRHYRLRRKK